jgi:ribosomal-protein-alanine N-acetyltransferase
LGAGRLIIFFGFARQICPMTQMLQTRRLTLRPLRAEDAPALLEARGDPEVMRFWDWPPQKNAAEVAEVIRDHESVIAEGTVHWWAVAAAADAPAIGECDLSEIDRHNKRAELGFLFRRASWGKGYAREAAEAVVNHAFGPLEMERLSARIHAGNEHGRRLLEKLGFSHEGMLHGYVLREGLRVDCLVFGLLRDRR